MSQSASTIQSTSDMQPEDSAGRGADGALRRGGMVPNTLAAVGATLVLVLASYLFSSPPMMFDQIAARMMLSRTFSCNFVGFNRQYPRPERMLVQGERARIVSSVMTSIWDYHTGQGADLYKGGGITPSNVLREFNLLGALGGYDRRSARRIRDKTIKGVVMHGIQWSPPERSFMNADVTWVFWIDQQTQMPIQMECRMGGTTYGYFDNIKWGEKLDDSLFDLQTDAISKALGFNARQNPPNGWPMGMPPVVNPNLGQFVLYPGQGVGFANFGTPARQLMSIVGVPEGGDLTHLDYSTKGCQLIVSPTGALQAIYCYADNRTSNGSRDYAGTTSLGIGIGSDRVRVESTYGKCDKVLHSGDQILLQYTNLGLTFTVADERVMGMYLWDTTGADAPTTQPMDQAVTEMKAPSGK